MIDGVSSKGRLYFGGQMQDFVTLPMGSEIGSFEIDTLLLWQSPPQPERPVSSKTRLACAMPQNRSQGLSVLCRPKPVPLFVIAASHL